MPRAPHTVPTARSRTTSVCFESCACSHGLYHLVSAIFTYLCVSGFMPSVGQFFASASCVRWRACLVSLLGLPIECSRGPHEAQASPLSLPDEGNRAGALQELPRDPGAVRVLVNGHAPRLLGERGPCAGVCASGPQGALWRSSVGSRFSFYHRCPKKRVYRPWQEPWPTPHP